MDQIYLGIIYLITIVFFLVSAVVLSTSESATNKFNHTFSALKQNIDITFKYSNMTEEDKINYKNNSCDIIFDSSIYRKGDAELCKIKMK